MSVLFVLKVNMRNAHPHRDWLVVSTFQLLRTTSLSLFEKQMPQRSRCQRAPRGVMSRVQRDQLCPVVVRHVMLNARCTLSFRLVPVDSTPVPTAFRLRRLPLP
jgi:hypothetical protein